MNNNIPANNNSKAKFSFTYSRKSDEYWLDNYRIFNGKENKQAISNVINFTDRIMKGEDIPCGIKWYHDIIDTEGRPNYKAIEALGILIKEIIPQEDHWHNVRYKDYQIKTQYLVEWSINLAFNWIEFINYDVATHLLGVLVAAYEFGHIPFKTSFSELQKFLNETKENIVSALDALEKLNLLFIKRRGSDGIIVELNHINILAITPENFDNLETLQRIEQRYSINVSRPDEEDYDA